MEIGEGKFVVGRTDGLAMKGTTPPTERIRFINLAEAELWIDGQSQIDPNGVAAGEYYIDGPEELINPLDKYAKKMPKTLQEALDTPTGVDVNREIMEQEIPNLDHSKASKWLSTQGVSFNTPTFWLVVSLLVRYKNGE